MGTKFSVCNLCVSTTGDNETYTQNKKNTGTRNADDSVRWLRKMHKALSITMESNRRVEIFGESSYTYDMWTKKLKGITANTVGKIYGTMLLQFKGCSESRKL